MGNLLSNRGFSCIALLFISIFTTILNGEETDLPFYDLKLLSQSVIPAKNVSAKLNLGDFISQDQSKKLVPLLCEMEAKHTYSYVVVNILISQKNQQEKPIQISDEQIISLAKGYNRCSFLLPFDEMNDGVWEGSLEIKYTKEEKPCIIQFEMEKITSQCLLDTFNQLKNEIENIVQAYEHHSKNDPVKVELELAIQLLKEAQKQLDEKRWEQLSDTLNTLNGQVSALKVGFLRTETELSKTDFFNYRSLNITPDGVSVNGNPASVIGVFLSEPTEEKVKKFTEFAVPLIVLPITLGELFPSESNINSLPTSVEQMISTLVDHQKFVIIQIDQTQIPLWCYDVIPQCVENGFVNVAVDKIQQLVKTGYTLLLSRFGNSPYLTGISLLSNPRFKYHGEPIRQAFIEEVKKMYPDRQSLNHIWHAHLANYDEITIWDEVAPSWSYQNRRAYQYDWQNFHRDLITQSLRQMFEELCSTHSNSVPLSITFPNTVFHLNETQFTPDREQVSPLLDFISLQVSFTPNDAVYAQGYPDPVVDVVWLQSVANNKPIAILRADLEFPREMPDRDKYKHTQSFLWEMTIAGAQIVAVNIKGDLQSEVPIWKAMADTNAFFLKHGEPIRKLQLSPPDVRILFSTSSQILDGGAPHLKSARLAFEGSSFSGYKVLFATEKAIQGGILNTTQVLILPQTLALENETFNLLTDFVRSDRYIIRVGTQIPYDPKGRSRRDVVQPTGNTVLVRGMNLPTEYLHGMDAIISKKALDPVPRPVNKAGYPLEGVKSRFLPTPDGGGYFYLLNLRKEPVICRLTGYMQAGIDLIHNEEVVFPKTLQPLELMFIKLIPPQYQKEVHVTSTTDHKSKKRNK